MNKHDAFEQGVLDEYERGEVSTCAEKNTLMDTKPEIYTLREDFLIPSNSYGWFAVLRNTLPFFLLLWLISYTADISPYVPWLMSPLLGLLIYRITVVMHDCVHYTLFKNRQLNSRMGLFLGAIVGVDFQEFAKQHWLHHRIYGKPEDPQGFHYSGLDEMNSVKLNWHIIKPLLGFNVFNTLHESILAPQSLWRLVRTGEVFVVMAVQVTILFIVTGSGKHLVLAIIPFTSAATFGLFFSQLRGISEHGAVGEVVAAGNVRSHAPHWLDRILFYDVNFNFHREHHLYPQCPSCHLPAVHQDLKPKSVGLNTSMFATLRTIYAASRSKRE